MAITKARWLLPNIPSGRPGHIDSARLNNTLEPWLVWLSGFSASLQIKRSLVQFPVGAHAWVVGQVSGCG